MRYSRFEQARMDATPTHMLNMHSYTPYDLPEVCDYCHSLFPAGMVQTSPVVSDGGDVFVCDRCMDDLLDDTPASELKAAWR